MEPTLKGMIVLLSIQLLKCKSWSLSRSKNVSVTSDSVPVHLKKTYEREKKLVESAFARNRNFRTKYFILSKFYTDEGGIKCFTTVCLPDREIIHSLKLVDNLLGQADKL